MKKLLHYRYGWLPIILGFVLLVSAAQFLRGRIDLTAEKRYSLSAAGIQLLDSLKQPLIITVYLNGDMPADYQKLRLATTDFLELLRRDAGRNILVRYETPGEDLADSLRPQLFDSLRRMGITYVQIQKSENGNVVSQLIWPSALVQADDGRTAAVDLRSSRTIFKQYDIVSELPAEDKEATRNAAEALLEFKFFQAIDRITRAKKPVVAYLVGNGQPVDLKVNDLGEKLRNDYNLAIFDLNQGFPHPEQISTLLMVKPTIPFTDVQKLKLDQYVQHGGNIIWCIDKLYAELDSLMRSQADFVAFDRNLNLDDLLFRYGVRINNDLVQDLNCSKIPLVVGQNPDGSPVMQRIPWPYYPFLSNPGHHPISRNLDRVLPIFPSSIDVVKTPGVTSTVLLATDTNSRRIASPAIVSLNSIRSENDFASFNKAHIPVAVLLEGNFSSLFANRQTPALLDSVQRGMSQPFLARGNGKGKQIVVSDASIVLNQVSRSTGPMPMGMIPGEDYQFANAPFFLNCVDFLCGNNLLFEARNKEVQLRLLDRVKVENEKIKWQIITVGLPLMLVALAAWMLPYYRRRKFA